MRPAGGGGGGTPAIVVPPKLSITPPNGDPIASDGAAGLLPEEINGSGADGSDTAPVFLGTIKDDKDGSGNVAYALPQVEDTPDTEYNNDDFAIRNGNQLFYTGAYSGDNEAPNAKKSFALKITRTDGGNTQTFDYILKLKDQIEVLTITPADGEPIASGGEALIPEEQDGSTTPISIGIIKDGTTAFGVTYKMVTATDPEDYESDNVHFQIGADGVTIFYVGPAVDFDSLPASERIFTISIERVSSTGHTETFRYVTNLQDTVPIITGYEVDSTTALPYLVAGDVGDSNLEMVFEVPAEGDTLTLDFVKRGGNVVLGTVITPQYEVAGDNTSKVTGFVIEWNVSLSWEQFLDIITGAGGDSFQNTYNKTSAEDFVIWQNYLKSVKYAGQDGPSTLIADILFDAGVTTFTGTEEGIVVDGTTGTGADTTIAVAAGETIANFAATDTVTWSIGEGENAGDAGALFDVDANGNLSFKAAATYATGANADNFHDVTVVADDGTSTDTYDLLVVVADVL